MNLVPDGSNILHFHADSHFLDGFNTHISGKTYD
jgi:hypothetical protein